MKKQLIAGLAVLALSLGSVPAMAAPEPPPAPPAPSTTAEKSVKTVPVIVTLDSGAGKVDATAKALAAKYNMTLRRQFSYLVNGFSAYIPASAIAELAREKGVVAVDRMRVYYPSMESATTLTQVDTAAENHGVDGEGLVVAIVDTGIDIAHQDMRLDDGVDTKLAPEPGFTAKVPYGYNFADGNTEVKDTTASQHGMHVAGIVAANGGEDADVATNGRINGVAPNAQLLAMKVFSNDPNRTGAAADDIMAAVEESVRRGADVINLSLGYPNGNEGQSVGEQRVIAKARAAGVEVIVAAGNEGQNGSPTGVNDDALGLLDDGTVGSPSTGTGAWSVASVENATTINSRGVAKNDASEYDFAHQLQAGSTDGTPMEIVDGGLGKVDDVLGKDFAGKYVLIQRGEIPFSDKFLNAQAAGAAGVIVYNHEEGGDEFAGMAGLENVTIPGAFIGHTDGVKLLEMIAQGTTTVSLTSEALIQANPAAMTPSTFTSWGAGPELGFKPEIAGIGGNVYSTVNDNRYETQSGTSMAAPHVAGVAALMIQKAEGDGTGRSRAEVVLRNRVALSNTALILDHDGVPYAPRQVGAGLVQVDDALDTQVYATVGGEPVVALKEVDGSTSFTVTLENDGDIDRAFTAGATCVVNEDEVSKEFTTTYCSDTDAIAASGTEVIVPAGGSAEVTYTLSVSGEDHWTQGWVTFESKDEDQPDLSVPYLGFAGDWNAEPIIDNPAYEGFDAPILSDGETTFTQTSLYTFINEGLYTFGDGEQFISPNNDGLADAVFAKVALLRNAKRVEVSILDESEKVVREIGSQDELVRPTLKEQLESPVNAAQTDFSDIRFDGKVYNPQTVAFEDLPDGKYFYRLSARMGDAWEPQTLDMPFGIDRVAPELEILSTEKNDDGDYVVRVKVTDDFSGINAVQGRFTWPSSVVISAGEPEDDVYTMTIPGGLADSVGYFEIYTSDRAINVVRKTVTLGDKLVIESEPTLADLDYINKNTESDQTGELLVEDGKLVLTGRAASDVVKVRAGDAEVEVPESGRFEIRPSVVQGENTVTVEALNADGEVVATKTFTFICDTEPPVVTITSPANRDEIAAQVEAGVVKVEGTVADNLGAVTVSIEGDEVEVVDGRFTADVPVSPGRLTLSVHARDAAGNLGVGTIVLAPADASTPLALEANLGFNQNFNVVTADDDALSAGEDGEYTYLYAGRFNRVPGSFLVNGEPVEVAEDGTFETPVALREGITGFNVRITDVDGTVLVDNKVKVLLDLTAPKIEMSKPGVNPDGALYLREAGEVEFAGTVSDNAFGYVLSINGDHVDQFFTIDDPGAAVNARDFATKVAAADGDTILVLLEDHLGNAFAQLIPVVVDAVAPVIEVDLEPEAKMKASETRTVNIRVTDDHLSDATVYVDGEAVVARQTVVTPAPGAGILLDEGKDLVGGQPSAVALREAGIEEADADGEAGEAGAVEGVTLLSFEVGPDFEVGEHEIVVDATDKAGNTSAAAVPFEVVKDPDPEPDPVDPTPNPDDTFVPGIDDGDLTDPDANGGHTWVPGQVGTTDGQKPGTPGGQAGQKAPEKGSLSYTGAAVTGVATLAGALLLVGALIRRRANA